MQCRYYRSHRLTYNFDLARLKLPFSLGLINLFPPQKLSTLFPVQMKRMYVLSGTKLFFSRNTSIHPNALDMQKCNIDRTCKGATVLHESYAPIETNPDISHPTS
ncbi:hypothetical protein TWF706_003629 [Orbilia oligospora]|nr:hypothetical protein TWF706_003629 [Orbilia oligospora]